MGAMCSTPEQIEQKRVNQKIEKQIRKDEESDIGNQKLLLLGAGECGKSTILKQINILHNQGYTDSDLKGLAGAVYSNTINGMAAVLKAREKFNYDLDHPEIEDDVQHILSISDSGKESLPFVQQTYTALKKLWADQSVRKAANRSSEYQLSESFTYFIEHIDRINEPDYTPTVDDLLRMRIATTGVVQTTINIRGTLFRIFDVGGQRSERKKWMHLFDNVNATIFVSAISEYDQLLMEDNKTNRLKESLRLFEQICNSKWFTQAAMILFMNKSDIFQEKIKRTNINILFTTYTGENTYTETVNYIRFRFERTNKYAHCKKIYSHVTCATDTNQIQLVIDSVIDMVIGKNLRGTGME